MTETFPIAPGKICVTGVLVLLCIVWLSITGVLWYSFSGARRARFEVSPAGLRLHGDFFSAIRQIAR